MNIGILKEIAHVNQRWVENKCQHYCSPIFTDSSLIYSESYIQHLSLIFIKYIFIFFNYILKYEYIATNNINYELGLYENQLSLVSLQRDLYFVLHLYIYTHVVHCVIHTLLIFY